VSEFRFRKYEILYDDQFYQPDCDRMVNILANGHAVFERAREEGFHTAVGRRDAGLTR
jgi:hypothetical protein